MSYNDKMDKKKIIEYTFFAILNIYLSSWVYIIVPGIIASLIGSVLSNCLIHFIEVKDELDFDIGLSIDICPIISMLLIILVFPVLYKIKFLSNIKNFLERFATDKNFLIKVLFSILIFDIIVYMLTTFFIDMDHHWRYIENLRINLFIYLMTFGGVLPCYLSFLLWYKWTHRKQINTNN